MHITVYLLNESLDPSSKLLRRSDLYEEIELEDPDSQGASWSLFVMQNPAQNVRWINDLRTIVRNPDRLRLQGQSAGAVLFVRARDRLFAVTFGQGFHDVRANHIVPDFGLRVAANSVNDKKVTSGESRGLGKGGRNAVSSLPVPNEMFALRLATTDEWIRRIGGQALESDFALTVSGADSLRLSVKEFSLRGLPSKLADALDMYESDTYLDRFPFLDYFRRLPAGVELIDELDEFVVEDMRQRDENIGFAAPDEFNFYNIDEYVLKSGRREPQICVDLTAEIVYRAIDALDAWEDPLNAVTVFARSGEDFVGPRRPLRQYVVHNIRLEGDAGDLQEYALTAGAWFSIASEYAEYVDEVVERVPVHKSLGLPKWDDAWLAENVEGAYSEERYNRHASNVPDRHLLDRHLYREKAGQRVEVCDILTAERQLICVKRLDGSDKMVHLFEQGSVSAGLMRDPPYRKFVLRALESAGGGRQFGRPSDWTFVFAIATSRRGPIKDILPFFARASLVSNYLAITEKGYKVALAKIRRA